MFEPENNYFNEEFIDIEGSEDNFEPIIEIKPKKPRIKHKFYIAS